MSIFDLLKEVEKRPGMYLGESSSERGAQLRNLQWFLIGYECALEHHAIAEVGADFLVRFAHYLRDRFGWSASAGPIAAVRSACSTDDEAWQSFWTLVWEFRKHLEAPKT